MIKEVELYGLILSGGKSSRMGHDKGAIIYHKKPQREFLFDLLKQLCTKVYVSCKSSTPLPEGMPYIIDQFDFETPLNGIASAIEKHPQTAWLTVPIDMPNMTIETLQYLCRNRDETKVATCFYDSDGKNPEPLVTIWEPDARIHILHFIRNGGKSPKAFLQQHPTRLLKIPDSSMLLNVNTPDELKNFFEQKQKNLPE